MKHEHMTTQDKIRRAREILKSVYTDSSMDRSSFSLMWANHDDPLPKDEKEVTDFIRRRTDLWRRTWIIDPLEEVLDLIGSIK